MGELRPIGEIAREVYEACIAAPKCATFLAEALEDVRRRGEIRESAPTCGGGGDSTGRWACETPQSRASSDCVRGTIVSVVTIRGKSTERAYTISLSRVQKGAYLHSR